MTDKMESKGEEHNVTSSQNKTKFICFCCYTNISNYNYMFRPFL